METTNILSGTQSFKPASKPPVALEGMENAPVGASSASATVAAASRRVTASSATAQSAPSGKRQEEQARKLEEAVKGVNDFFQSARRTLQFSLHGDTGRMVAQIKDEKTGEVIRQIPAEEVLELAKRLDELSGLLFKEKV